MSFQPSVHSYGEASALDKAAAFLQSAAPALTLAQELVGKTAAEKVAIIKARITNYQRMMKTAPYSIVPGDAWYRNEIAKMKAQIAPLEEEAARDASASADYSIWRQLTTVGGVVGVGLGLAVTYFVVQKARS